MRRASTQRKSSRVLVRVVASLCAWRAISVTGCASAPLPRPSDDIIAVASVSTISDSGNEPAEARPCRHDLRRRYLPNAIPQSDDDDKVSKSQGPRLIAYEDQGCGTGLSIRAPAVKVPVVHFLLQAGVHGDEAIPPQLLLFMMNRYAQGRGELARFSALASRAFGIDVRVDFVPLANPNGFIAGSRGNGAGVDLNRNFPDGWVASRSERISHGKFPLSEVESDALWQYYRRLNFRSVVDLHGYGDMLVFPSPEVASQPDGDRDDELETWRRAVHRQAEILFGLTQNTTAAELSHYGSGEQSLYSRLGTLALCLEVNLESLAPLYSDTLTTKARESIVHYVETWDRAGNISDVTPNDTAAKSEAEAYESLVAQAFLFAAGEPLLADDEALDWSFDF